MVLTGLEKEKDHLRGAMKYSVGEEVSQLRERQSAETKWSSKVSLATNVIIWMTCEPNLF